MLPPVIRSEFRKLSTVRGPWLLLAAAPLLVVAGISGLARSSGNLHDPALQSKALAHVGLAATFTLIFGITAVAGEYRHRTITDSYLSFPERRRVIAAKLTVYGILGAGTGLTCSLVAVAVAAAWWAARGTTFHLGAAGTWSTLGGGVAVNVAFAAIGVGTGGADPEPDRRGRGRARLGRGGRGDRRAACRTRAGALAAVRGQRGSRPGGPHGGGRPAAAVGRRGGAARVRRRIRRRRAGHYYQA
jgi:hypothetical protein